MDAHGMAPGRLDVIGGVADYSGALVLQKTIAATTTVRVRFVADPEAGWFFESDGESYTLPLRVLNALPDPDILVRIPKWVRYPLGCALVLMEEKQIDPPAALRFSITSDVPQNMGVSSSAALEIATLRALGTLLDISFSGTEIALMGQRAEHEYVGAPCGLMDQLACAFGVDGALLPILCRPDLVQDAIQLPNELRVAGWPSGVEHAVSDGPYRTARAATFAGLSMLEFLCEEKWAYASEVPPERLAEFDLRLPDVRGEYPRESEFPAQAGLAFAVEEHRRVHTFIEALAEGDWVRAGQQMYDSHAGYSAIGLGHPRTDEMVQQLRDMGPEQGVYGARVSGGGSGGTVVVLFEERSRGALEALAGGPGILIS